MSLRFYIYIYTLGLMASVFCLFFMFGVIEPKEAEWWAFVFVYLLFFFIFWAIAFLSSFFFRSRFKSYPIVMDLVKTSRRDGLIVATALVITIITGGLGILTWWNFLILLGIVVITILLFEN